MAQQNRNALRQFDLAALESVDVRTVDPASLVDIREVAIDAKQPKQDRIASFIEQMLADLDYLVELPDGGTAILETPCRQYNCRSPERAP